MNEILADTWTEHVERLRLGIQPRDALGRLSPVGGLGLHLEDVPKPWPVRPRAGGVVPDDVGLPGVAESPSGRFAIRFVGSEPAGWDRLALRIVESSRRYVPRRLSVPVPGYPTVLQGDAAHEANPTTPLTPRATRPALFPGAAYGTNAGATVVRGRVTWDDDGTVVRWTRIDATTADPIVVHHDDGSVTELQPALGRAQGDDRGEFLLVIAPLPNEVTGTTDAPRARDGTETAAGENAGTWPASARSPPSGRASSRC